ncbi:MAG: T9SS type A sorting domain-containing protein [Flavobacteriales bacterium]|nr:T9SS type A sorting domain-containing protein [Flavobacteriales bacterium]
MRKHLLFVLLLTAGIWQSASAQRYLEEVFTDDQIMVETTVYATNIDFMTSNLAGTNVPVDIGTLSNVVDNNLDFPAAYYDVMDESTDLKITDISMDIYYPDMEVDDIDARPVIVYLHTGNFLPPPLNGSCTGLRTDSAAVALCRGWARRGYVAISADYRLGWNPLGTTIEIRRGTLLNAVYRAIHDAKMAVRYVRADAMDSNTWGIDETKIALYGQGSGGYIATSYATLDDAPTELFLDKFLPSQFDPNTSYVDTLMVGVPEGWGFPNSLNLYRDNGVSADVNMVVNAGGAMADESWLGPGDAPMCAINCVRDDFAPFDAGTVIVPTTQEEVVDVHGANVYIQKCNDLGINDVFAGIPDGDPYTDRARGLYGETFEVSNAGQITVASTPEGLFPLIRPLASFLSNESAPWEWWDPLSPISQTEIAPGITAHMASLASNPDMSPEKGMAYVDSIQGYILPRIMCALDLPENWCADAPPANNECMDATDIDNLFHTNSTTTVISDIYDNSAATSTDSDPTTGFLDCFGEPSFNVEPVLNNTLWFTFEGDGEDYTIETGDCGGGLDDYIDSGDTQFQIYTGDCGNLVPVAGGCSEDSENAVTDNYFAGLDFTTEADQTYYIMIDGFNGEGVAEVGVLADGQYCIHITQLTINVEELNSYNVSIFPNPAKDQVRINSDLIVDRLEIYNVVGEVVMSVERPQSRSLTLDLSDLSEGIYVVTTFAGELQSTQRLVIE